MMEVLLQNRPKEGQGKKKNTLVSGNAGDGENFHPGDRKFILFNHLIAFLQ